MLKKDTKDWLARKFRAELGKAERDKLIHEFWLALGDNYSTVVGFRVVVGPDSSEQTTRFRRFGLDEKDG
jgi:hypothetical protein